MLFCAKTPKSGCSIAWNFCGNSFFSFLFPPTESEVNVPDFFGRKLSELKSSSWKAYLVKIFNIKLTKQEHAKINSSKLGLRLESTINLRRAQKQRSDLRRETIKAKKQRERRKLKAMKVKSRRNVWDWLRNTHLRDKLARLVIKN